MISRNLHVIEMSFNVPVMIYGIWYARYDMLFPNANIRPFILGMGFTPLQWFPKVIMTQSSLSNLPQHAHDLRTT